MGDRDDDARSVPALAGAGSPVAGARWSRLLLAVNRDLARLDDESELAGAVCRRLVDSGVALGAALGVVDEGGLRPMAVAGDDGECAPQGPGWAAAFGPSGAAAQALVGRPLAAGFLGLTLSAGEGVPPTGVLLLFVGTAQGSDDDDDDRRSALAELAVDVGAALARGTDRWRANRRQIFLLEHALDAHSDPVYIIQPGATFAYVNQAAADQLGYTRAELMGGMSVFDVDPTFGPGGHGARWRDRAAPHHTRFRTSHRARSGELIPVEIYATRFQYEDALINVAISHDLRPRLAVETQLRAHEQRYHSVVTSLREAVLLHDADGRVVTVNPAAERLLGYAAAELTGHPLDAERVDPRCEDGRPVATSELPASRTLRTGVAESEIVLSLRRRDGRRIWVSVSTQPIAAPDGGLLSAVVSTLRDVTDEREALAALRARERDYRSLAENIPALMVRWDRAHRRVFVNSAFAEAVGAGRDVARLIGERLGSGYATPSDLAGPVVARIERALAEVFATGQPAELETYLPAGAGQRTHIMRLVPERNERGEVMTVLGVSHDVSTLKETERQLRSLAEHSPDLVLRFDRDARYLFVNAALERVTGHPASASLGSVLGEVGGPDGQLTPIYAQLKAAVRSVWDTGVPAELEAEWPLAQGDLVLESRLFPERDEHGAIVSVLTLVRDVTARRRAEAALHVSERRLVEVTEHIDEVFRLSEAATGRVVYLSAAYQRVFRRDPDEVLADPAAWLAPVLATDRARVADALRRQAEGYDLEYQIGGPDGVCWIHERAFPIRDERGRVVRVAAVARDVTPRRRLEDQLRQALKLEAVGRLAGGIAHDFNNLLAVVQMEGSLLLDQPLEPDVRQALQIIAETTERAADLTRQLLTFSRQQVPRFQAIDLGEAIRGMSKLLSRTLPEHITFDTRVAPAVPAVRADVGMMEQVLMNLVLNARDAMPAGGRLTVEVDVVEVGHERVAVRPGVEAGRFARLRVSDTGTGISADALPYIFEPFFTTKEVGRGTGLGLSTAFGIIEQHGGWLEVESQPGAGSCFAAYLPALAVAAVTPSMAARATAPRGTETILLVEDEPAVRAASRAVLERLGYRVLEADSARSARAVWAQQGTAVALLVTDLVMPGDASGRELADELVRAAPCLRVLYTSGYSPDVVARLLPLDDGRGFLPKPCTALQLAVAVRACLDEPRPGRRPS